MLKFSNGLTVAWQHGNTCFNLTQPASSATMAKKTNLFEHESLQDKDAIVQYLKALTDGIEKGEVELSDDDEKVTLKPTPFGRFKLKATCSKKAQELRIKISWVGHEDGGDSDQPLHIQPPSK
jgi:amphi-Trp domain-containing protein